MQIRSHADYDLWQKTMNLQRNKAEIRIKKCQNECKIMHCKAECTIDLHVEFIKYILLTIHNHTVNIIQIVYQCQAECTRQEVYTIKISRLKEK